MDNLPQNTQSSPVNGYGLARRAEPKVAKGEDICDKAKAGLEATIDFSRASCVLKVQQKDSKGLALVRAEELNGQHDIRLIHVKGGRKMQFRLVKPSGTSLSNSDSYVIVTPTNIVHWNGRNSSMMKKAKAADLAQLIKKQREYGCNCRLIQTIEHYGKNINSNLLKHFNETDIEINNSNDVNDSEYEEDMIKSTVILELQKLEDKEDFDFVFSSELSGKILRQKYLDTNKVFIFCFKSYILDFGTEVYLWIGSKFKTIDKNSLSELAVKYFENSTNYLDGISKLSSNAYESLGYTFVDETPRPSWVTLEKIKERCENILFKKKFSEWKDFAVPNRIKSVDPSEVKRKPIKLEEALKQDFAVDYILNGAVINRGQGGMDPDLGFNYCVVQDDYSVFRVVDNEFKKCEDPNYNVFYSGEAYLIEWKITYKRRDIKNLAGTDMTDESFGREILIYFYWQGRDCSVNEKAMSAVLTIFYVNKKSTQVHISQDLENPAFLSIFKNQYISCIGKSDSFLIDEVHMFLIRGSLNNEQYLIEVEPRFESLRSQAEFIVVNPKEGKIYNWIGITSSRCVDAHVFLPCIVKLFPNLPKDLMLEVINERKEPHSFKTCISYPSDTSSFDKTISKIEFCCYFRRVNKQIIECHRIDSVHFQIKNHDSKRVIFDKFPVCQVNLYSLHQPALVLICSGSSTFLWHGWKPSKNGSEENLDELASQSVLKDYNFLELKSAVIEDTMKFLRPNHFSKEIIEVHAGFEPNEFISLFPFWTTHENIKNVQERLGRNVNSPSIITEVNAQKRTEYPYEVLKKRPLPDEVNPLEIEMYLSDTEFEQIFKCTKEEFKNLQKWKQLDLKKKHQLY